jgi:protoporphyrinogen oxidase
MLEAKFGDRYGDVPALWFWTRFNREKGSSKGEQKGYIRGGYKRITEAFAKRFDELGVTVCMGDKIENVDLDEQGQVMVKTAAGTQSFDQVIITLPWPAIAKVVGEKLKQQDATPDWTIDFQGVINHVLFLKRPLTKHYWLATPEAGFPFDGVVETSTLTNETDRGADRHVVYLTKYLHRDDPRFALSDGEFRQAWWTALQGLFPDLRDEDIETEFVFRAPFVEPVYTRGYLKRRPPEVLATGKVYLATTAQVYPVVTSWNGSVIQAARTLEAMAVG